MPNVILIGGSAALYEMLRGDSRWNVLRAMHAKQASGSVPDDPRSWHLVIDDCSHADIAAAEADALVSNAYLKEATNARGIMFCSDSHDDWSAQAPPGYQDFEANPTKSDKASHLIDFFDDDRLQGAFVNRYLQSFLFGHATSSRRVPLMTNSYGQPLAVLDTRGFLPERLILIDLADDKTRLKAFQHLLYRTVPKLWPEVYSDQFRPRRVVELERLREQEISDRRARVAEIDTAINAELAFFAAYTPLTLLADDALKDLVARAFKQVFGCEIVDLDEETEEGQPRTLDLVVRRERWCALVEVRSSGNRAAREADIERLDDNATKVGKKYGTPDSKILVFNGLYRREPQQRTEEALFSQHVRDEARGRGITLLSTQLLLEAIEAHRNGEVTADAFVGALRASGVFQPPWSRVAEAAADKASGDGRGAPSVSRLGPPPP